MSQQQTLKIVITAENKAAIDAMKETITGLQGVSKAGENLGDPMKRASQANFAFNQILRESPAFAYNASTGIMALSNNLPILTDSLSAARASGLGWTQILKGMAMQLVSLPGLLSIGTLALTLFLHAKEKSAKATREAKDANDSYNRSLAEELVNLRVLRSTAENANAPMEARIKAVNELQSNYSNYLGNLSKEQILVGNVGSAYDALTNAILKMSKAKAAQGQMTANFTKLLEIEKKVAEERTQAEERAAKARPIVRETGAGGQVLMSIEAQQRAIFDGASARVKQLREEQKGYEEDNKRLLGVIEQNLVKPLKTATDQVKSFKNEAAKIEVELMVPGQVEISEYLNNLEQSLRRAQQARPVRLAPDTNVRDRLRIDRNQQPLFMGATAAHSQAANIAGQQLGQALMQGMNSTIQPQIDALGQFMQGQLLQSFSAFSDTFIDGLMQGKNAADSLMDSLKQLMADLAKMLIRAALFKLIMGGVGLATGGAGVGLGQILGAAIGGGRRGMATGGIVPQGFPNDSFPANLQSGEMVIPLNRLQGIMNTMGGGGFGGNLQLQSTLRGRDLLLWIERAQQGRGFTG